MDLEPQSASAEPSRTPVPSIKEVWESPTADLWHAALANYWKFVRPHNLALEKRLGTLDLEVLRALDPKGWFDFLHDDYFRWKYTAANRYATTTHSLNKYLQDGALNELYSIKLRLLSLDTTNAKNALNTAQEIKGMGTAGASGLLAMMYPKAFGTVDQFVVKALKSVENLPEANVLRHMREDSLNTKHGVALIGIMRRKAAELNRRFATEEWTPRKVDMVLWTYGRDEDPPRTKAKSLDAGLWIQRSHFTMR